MTINLPSGGDDTSCAGLRWGGLPREAPASGCAQGPKGVGEWTQTQSDQAHDSCGTRCPRPLMKRPRVRSATALTQWRSL